MNYATSDDKLTVHICSISFQSVTIPCYTGRKHHQSHTTLCHSTCQPSHIHDCVCVCVCTSTGYLILSSPLCSYRYTNTHRTRLKRPYIHYIHVHALYRGMYILTLALGMYNILTSALGPMNTSPSRPPVITRACFGLPIL